MKKIIYSLMVLAMAAFTFSSCEDVPAPYDTPVKPTTPEATTTGTESDPYTVTDAKLVGSGSNVFVKGYIVGYVPDKSLSEAIFGATGDNVTTSNFLIAASADETNVNNCMPVQLPVGAVRSGLNLKDNPGNLGQEVTLCGNIENYFSTTGLKSAAWAKIGDKEFGTKPGGGDTPAGEAKGTGTKEDPFNSIAAINYVKSLGADVTSENDVYIKGKIREIKEQYSAQYGNTSVTIADDATSEVFTIWRALYFNNQKWAEGNDELKEGDEVVFCGKVVNYKGNTPETVQGQAYLVSLNGKTSGGGSVDPTPTPTPSEGLVIDGTNVTMTNAKATIAEGESVKIDLNTVGLTDGQSNPTITANGVTITFDANGQEQKPTFKNGTKGVRVYANNKIVITGANNIAKIVFTCDSYNNTTYVGNNTATITFDGKTATYVNTWPQPGGTQLRVQTVEIFYAK